VGCHREAGAHRGEGSELGQKNCDVVSPVLVEASFRKDELHVGCHKEARAHGGFSTGGWHTERG